MPARRPRSSSGIVWFHIAARKIPLTMSKPPPRVRKSSTSQTFPTTPAAATASPQPAAARTTIRPCRWIRDVQPPVSDTSSAPAGNAAYISPSDHSAPSSSARKGSTASGIAKSIAAMSTT
jgi:hypothetical protein